MRIVFATWGSLGDLHPYMALALELQRRGHTTSIATLNAWRDAVLGAGLGFHPVRPDVPSDPEVARQLVRRLLDAADGPKYLFREVLGPAIRQTYDDTLAAIRADGGADLLVTHQVPVVGRMVAGITGIPWVSAVLLPMGFLSAYDPPTPPQAPGLRRIAAAHPAIARVLLALARASTRSWVEPIYRFREELGLSRGANPLFEGQHSPALVLALFSPIFAAKQPDFPPQTVVTGFPFYDAASSRPVDPELPRFLDAGPPPLVFTLGSSAVWIEENFYDAAIAAARTLGRRALLLAGDRVPRLRANGLPDSILAVEYAPHSLVMPRAAAVIHQGGVGTTAQALRSGRPQVVVPFGQDQPDNARRCVTLGVARTMPSKAIAADRLTREIAALLEDQGYARRASEVGAAIRAENGTVAACDAIERAVAGP